MVTNQKRKLYDTIMFLNYAIPHAKYAFIKKHGAKRHHNFRHISTFCTFSRVLRDKVLIIR